MASAVAVPAAAAARGRPGAHTKDFSAACVREITRRFHYRLRYRLFIIIIITITIYLFFLPNEIPARVLIPGGLERRRRRRRRLGNWPGPARVHEN